MAETTSGMDDSMIDRRVVLSGALAGAALSCAGCSVVVNEVLSDEPPQPGSFGTIIEIGEVDTVNEDIIANNGFLYRPEGRAWIVAYPEEFVDAAKAVYPEVLHAGLEAGFLALFQKCPHLGCRVPECGVSQQFECPCHGSMYSHYGEKIGGPAPRGMDLFPSIIDNGMLSIDTANIVEGMPIGTNVTSWQIADATCLGASSH